MLNKSVRSKYRPEYPVDFKFDYKDPATLYRFIMDGGKILPSRISKISHSQQRKVAAQVKKARNIYLLPTGTSNYDHFKYPEAISPKPFEI
ncbi:MAG: 30S ribosomal protein S18 [Bdellovibrionaceae bacterium]|nr:30S ribosomal protein S18 [Pseudobdellovibrionaceae bacterium]